MATTARKLRHGWELRQPGENSDPYPPNPPEFLVTLAYQLLRKGQL